MIDGRLDEPAWAQAAVIRDFVQVLPREGDPPSEPTEVRLLYDERHLYLGIRCFDSDPAGILARQMRHEGSFLSDDTVAFVLDPFRQQREGYFFMVNPVGARTDGLVEDRERVNVQWDTVWWARARIDEEGWAVEVRIPFSSLSFDPRSDTWGFNIERTIRRRQERVRWAGVSRAREISYLPQQGLISGLKGMRQGIGLEVRPSLALKFIDDAADGTDWEVRPSLDLTYHLTPQLKANATVNTDFAEAEVDDRVANLTRFPLFFPEKRDFFLQDASLFSFGGLRTPTLLPYYSRRMGLDADGSPVDILAGGRLTGRLDGTSLALLDVQQEEYDGVPSKNLFVGRLSTRVFGESNAGLLVTHGDPQSAGDNTVLGVDFNYLNTSLAPQKTLAGNLWALGSDSEDRQATDYAFGMDLDYPNEPLDLHLFYRQIGEQFDPALGFVRRRGIRQYIGSGRYIWRPNTRLVRSVSFGARPIWTTDLENRLIAEDHDLPYLWISSPSLDRLMLAWTLERDVVDEAFEMHQGVWIPPEDYQNNELSVRFFASDARPAGVDLGWETGDYYQGRRTEYSAGLDLRPNRHLSARVGYRLTEVQTPWGDFTVRIASARLTLALTADLTWSTLAQYDNDSDVVGINSRFRWTWRPGYNLYLVLNQGYLLDRWNFRRQSTDLTLKAVAAIRF